MPRNACRELLVQAIRLDQIAIDADCHEFPNVALRPNIKLRSFSTLPPAIKLWPSPHSSVLPPAIPVNYQSASQARRLMLNFGPSPPKCVDHLGTR